MKCKNPKCRKEFEPEVTMQRYCHIKCRDQAANARAIAKRKKTKKLYHRICQRKECDIHFTTTRIRKMYHDESCRKIALYETKKKKLSEESGRIASVKRVDLTPYLTRGLISGCGGGSYMVDA